MTDVQQRLAAIHERLRRLESSTGDVRRLIVTQLAAEVPYLLAMVERLQRENARLAEWAVHQAGGRESS